MVLTQRKDLILIVREFPKEDKSIIHVSLFMLTKHYDYR